MLHDLDTTLKKLLLREITTLEEDQIFFEAPAANFQSTALALNLFLYDVRENTDLRANDWQVERRGATVLKQRAPRRVDCSYLITAWAQKAQDEHNLLGQVMRALLRNGTIPADVLHGSLEGQQLPTSVLQPSNLQSLGEFWQAMGNQPRAVLNYTVTISVDVFEPIEVPAAVEPVSRMTLMGPAKEQQ